MKKKSEDGPPVPHEKELQEYINSLSPKERELYGVELAPDTEEFVDPLIQVRKEMSHKR